MQQEDKRGRRRSAQGGQQSGGRPAGKMSPGDEAPPGTPGTGENICPACGGEGTLKGQQCANCGGTGMIVQGIGGA